jgi:hypothetical protein
LWTQVRREELEMKTEYLPWYALAVAIAFVGALAFGVPVSTLLLLAAVLACPLMMMFMMGGHGHRTDDRSAGRSQRPGGD